MTNNKIDDFINLLGVDKEIPSVLTLGQFLVNWEDLYFTVEDSLNEYLGIEGGYNCGLKITTSNDKLVIYSLYPDFNYPDFAKRILPDNGAIFCCDITKESETKTQLNLLVKILNKTHTVSIDLHISTYKIDNKLTMNYPDDLFFKEHTLLPALIQSQVPITAPKTNPYANHTYSAYKALLFHQIKAVSKK